MTTALAVRGQDNRDPAKASGMLRRAAEKYVKDGCRAIGPAMVWAGYRQNTAKDPTANGYTHDWLVAVARYWNKGTQITARVHLGAAIAALRGMIDDPLSPPAARGAAAKVIIDVAGKEEEKIDTNVVAAEEQAKWMNQIRHWKRTFLRRGILLGQENGPRAERMLAELNWMLGKGERPAWMDVEEETDEPEENEVRVLRNDGGGPEELPLPLRDVQAGEVDEGVQRPEGDTQPGAYLEAEVVAEPDGE